MPSFTIYKGSKDGSPKKDTTTRPDELKGDQVHVRVTASGLCGTDLHYAHQDMCLGHEGVGIVEATGPDCKVVQEGDRVGWGYMHDACGHCKDCLEGFNTFCAERQLYGYSNLDQGSFAEGGVWREAFLFKIPDEIKDEHAAPLQCGGATVYTALQGLQPNDVVGVMGVGGLGHLAIQFAAKLGARVVVLSRSDRKKGEAMDLGAHDFIATANLAEDFQPAHKITRLLVTTSAQPNWDQVLPMMAHRSTIYPLSVSEDKLEMPYMPILVQGLNIQGSLVANRAVHHQMLAFAALHDIKPIIEKFPMSEDGLKSAMVKLEKGDVCYRAVLMTNA